MRQRRQRGERGATLVEAAVSSFVFTVGALGLIGLLVTGSQGMTTAEDVTQATLLARAKLGELASQPYDSIVDGEDASSLTAGAGRSERQYTRKWTVVEPVTDLAYKEITCEVTWTDPRAKDTRMVRMTGGKSRQ